MKRNNKLTKLAISTLLIASTVAYGSSVSAAPNCDPNSPLTQAFGGCGGVLGGTLDLKSIIALIFRFLLIGAILWVVWNIVRAGITIAGAKEDAEQRQNGLKSIVNAAIGLVVALSAFIITNTITNQLGTPIDASNVGTTCRGVVNVNGKEITKIGTLDSSDGQCKDVNGQVIPNSNL